MRARYPDDSGFIERDGVKVTYDVYGIGEPTVLLLPTWSLVHSRRWKMQIRDGGWHHALRRPPSHRVRWVPEPRRLRRARARRVLRQLQGAALHLVRPR